MTHQEHQAKQQQPVRSRPDHPSDCARCYPGDRPHNYLPMERA